MSDTRIDQNGREWAPHPCGVGEILISTGNTPPAPAKPAKAEKASKAR